MSLEQTGVVIHIAETDITTTLFDSKEVGEVVQRIDICRTVAESLRVFASPIRLCLVLPHPDIE